MNALQNIGRMIEEHAQIELERKFPGEFIINGYNENGWYFKVRGFKNLTDEQLERVINTFPVELNGKWYDFANYMDVDNDGDRMWSASIAVVPRQ